MKKTLALLLGIIFLSAICVTPVHAAGFTFYKTSFNSAWELTASGSGWLMKYGYNTAWINEDYTHTYHSSNHHVATVCNANGCFSDEDSGGKWAGIEVRHRGTNVSYSISF